MSTEDSSPKFSNGYQQRAWLINDFMNKNESSQSFSRPIKKLNPRFSIQDQKFKKNNPITASFESKIPNKAIRQQSSNITESSHA